MNKLIFLVIVCMALSGCYKSNFDKDTEEVIAQCKKVNGLITIQITQYTLGTSSSIGCMAQTKKLKD